MSIIIPDVWQAMAIVAFVPDPVFILNRGFKSVYRAPQPLWGPGVVLLEPETFLPLQDTGMGGASPPTGVVDINDPATYPTVWCQFAATLDPAPPGPFDPNVFEPASARRFIVRMGTMSALGVQTPADLPFVLWQVRAPGPPRTFP